MTTLYDLLAFTGFQIVISYDDNLPTSERALLDDYCEFEEFDCVQGHILASIGEVKHLHS